MERSRNGAGLAGLSARTTAGWTRSPPAPRPSPRLHYLLSDLARWLCSEALCGEARTTFHTLCTAPESSAHKGEKGKLPMPKQRGKRGEARRTGRGAVRRPPWPAVMPEPRSGSRAAQPCPQAGLGPGSDISPRAGTRFGRRDRIQNRSTNFTCWISLFR